MTSKEMAVRAALQELETLRASNYEEEQRRRRAFLEKSPLAADLMQQREIILEGGIKRAFQNPNNAAQIAANLSTEIDQINKRLRQELTSQGFPEDWLQPVHQCEACGDTGYVGDLVKEPCICLKQKAMNWLYKQEGLEGLLDENFETFDERVFPDIPQEGQKRSQREYMNLVRARCKSFADSFIENDGSSVLLYGETGVGKTFLMNCIAQRVLSRGYSVVFISAYRIAEILREYQFDGSETDLVNELLTCDLLCIDDLGAEPLYRGNTISGLYYVVNERYRADRSMVITTNCSIPQMYERYGDRIAARVCNPGKTQIFHLPGIDIRSRINSLKKGFSAENNDG